MILFKFLLMFILLAVALIILIPFKYKIEGSYYNKFKGEVSISILLGLVAFIYSLDMENNKKLIFRFMNFKKNLSIKKPSNKNFDGGKLLENIKNSNLKGLNNKKFIKKAIELAKKIWKNIKPSKIFIKGEIGFEDPMLTGLLFSILNQIIYLPNEFDIKLQPVFYESQFEGEAVIDGKIWIFAVFTALIKFLLKKPRKNILKI